MLRRNKRRWLLAEEEEYNPLAGLANMVDVMLVFACGLLVALVLSWNLQDVFLKDLSPVQRQQLLQAIKNMVTVEQGKELEEIPQLGSGSGSGYQELGTVYRDPKTGKLIMIENRKE
ncbi:DUF2149 domain-containing protein [Calderihabitans maritimus]|uniref:DUF2149 domain-containing protein n=1 Tax=Calderihabitans maritimus TaxID=1246530 RepID=A0A1Z5HT17_9FIRM|nr:DUF2149 domain-containing protein [Calderihabitans maritimus]GAW92497.1 hypothetical protein Desgi_0816 [Calderihabitans maritimus]